MSSFQCGRSAFIWFMCSGRKLLVFSARIEIQRFFVLGVEINLILEWGSKLTGFQCWGRNWLRFSVKIEIDMFFVRG